MVLQTEFARKKKVSCLKYTDGFYSVCDIVIYRWLCTVSKFVGECLEYRPKISICKFVGECVKCRQINFVGKTFCNSLF
jgi:hypothetical protein